MKKTLSIVVIIIVVLVGGVVLTKNLEKSDADTISRNGLHWHPELTLYVKGEKQILPANLGVSGTSMTPVHTHDDANQGIIHLEFSSTVRKNDIRLEEFFKAWGKDINSFGTNVKMMVNGKENTELERYVMQDEDKIELRYE